MADERTDPNVREALTEVELYLSDTLPPLVVAGSMELLVGLPPDVIAGTIRSWTTAQSSRDASASLSDFIFHAAKKIHMLGEFRLIPQPELSAYLERLKPLLLAACPEDDRPLLAENLARLDDKVASGTSTPVAMIHRQAGASRASTAGSSAPASGGDGLDRRRIGLLLERLEAQARQTSAPAARAALDETLAAAALQSETAREIEGHLTRLRGAGVEIGTADVFRALASSLPGWVLPSSGAWQSAAPSPAVDAMQRMVAEAEDPRETSRRFSELVRAAVERFNEGSLPQAVATLEAAERLIAEKKVDSGTIEVARRKGDEAMDPERLRAAAENPAHHAGLRRLLNFFSSLSPEGLLEQLAHEEKRDRRRMLLALLEIHGDPARAAALAALAGAPPERAATDWYFLRNLLYLLRRIPRPPDANLGEEAEATAHLATPLLAPPLVKEAIANLAQLRHERAEGALTALLGDLEQALAAPDEGVDVKELQQLLDRTAAALARVGTPSARRAILEHAAKKDPKLGDTGARLAELGAADLSGDSETVQRLLERLKSNLPFKVFGVAVQKNEQALVRTIEALSGTPAPAVVAALEETARRFPDKEIGRAAARAAASLKKPRPAAEPPAPTDIAGPSAAEPSVAKPAPTAPAGAALTGDLEIFGLPALLQSLSDSSVSGSLTLRDAKGQMFGTMRLAGGKLRSCKTGQLTGEDAYYQLLERPCPGQFQFVKSDAADETASGHVREILPLTLEAMRRHDELKQLSALVPDGAALKPTDRRASPHPSEKDGLLQKDLWSRVSKGATPLECEAEARCDAYRVRRLLAHWLEEGALSIQEERA